MWRRLSVVVGLLVVIVIILGGSVVVLLSSGSSDSGAISGSAADPFNEVSNSLDTNVNFEREAPDIGNTSSEQAQRIVIKSATLSITVESVSEKVVSISTMAEGMGGWVVSSTTYGSEDRRSGSIAIRVPAEQFDTAIANIKANVEEVGIEQITGQDVTDEFTDLQSRLRNLQAAESQMQTFMEDAQDTDEVLAVYNELVSLRGDIEVTQGRINLLQDSASFSSITVNLGEPFEDNHEEDEEDNPWKPGETIGDAFDALVAALRGLGNIVIWLTIFVGPLVIVTGLPGWLGWRFIGKKIWREQAPTPSESEEE